MPGDYSKFSTFEVDWPADRVLRLTLNNPETLNSLDKIGHNHMTYVWNEIDADPLAATAEGSAFAHWMRYHKPRGDGDGWVASELVDGGRVRWERRRAQQGGVLALEWESLPWGGLVQSLGGRAVLEMPAWGIA